MFLWQCEAREKTTASPERIWELWANVDNWPLWDKDVAWCRLESVFASGERLTMKPTKGPVTKCLLLEVAVNRSFTTRSRLPLATVEFRHEFINEEIIHQVEMRGLLAPLFSRLFGKDIGKGLPVAVKTLKEMAEKNPI